MRARERARVHEVVQAFERPDGIAGFSRVDKPAHAALAWVYVLDDRYILRARVLDGDTEAAFAREQALLEEAGRELSPWTMPRPLPTRGGARFVIAFDRLWTLHQALPGRILCPWQEMHLLGEGDLERLVTAERRMHDATRGRFTHGAPAAFPTAAARDLAEVGPRLSPSARTRLASALALARSAARGASLGDLAFVHGDFHYGNVLLDAQGQVSGLIDLDWCRVGHPLEDLGYTAMMLLRDYAHHRVRLELLEGIEGWYGVEPHERELVRAYVLLYALYDVRVFQDAHDLPDRDMYLDVQLTLVETACAALRP